MAYPEKYLQTGEASITGLKVAKSMRWIGTAVFSHASGNWACAFAT